MNPRKLMKQMSDMQEKMQREMADTVVDGSAGGGMVTVRMNGHRQVLAVVLDPEVVDPEDVSMLQDLIVAACNEAGRKVDETLQGQLQGMTAGLPIPPGLF